MPGLASTIATLGAAGLPRAEALSGALRALPGSSRFLAGRPAPLVQLEERLAREEGYTRARLVQKIQARLGALEGGEAPPSGDAVALGLQRVERALRTSPLHIGFTCGHRFFDGAEAFFSKGTYENSFVRYGAPDEFSSKYPVYAALNFSQRGHKGWGNSCLVLQPHLLDHAKLTSRDSGDPDFGYLAREGTPRHLLPIIEDWVQLKNHFPSYWKALSGEERTPVPWIDISMDLPVEAQLFTPDGRLHPQEIAMICVDERELTESASREGVNPERRHDALRRFEGETGVPVVIRPAGPQGAPFLDVPGYSAVVAAYTARLVGLESAASVTPTPGLFPVPSSSLHYTQILERSGVHSSPSPSVTLSL